MKENGGAITQDGVVSMHGDEGFFVVGCIKDLGEQRRS